MLQTGGELIYTLMSGRSCILQLHHAVDQFAVMIGFAAFHVM